MIGDFEKADKAFANSIDYAEKADSIIGEWITKCVKNRILFLRAVISTAEFDMLLDSAYRAFGRLESTNHVAKRWMMVVRHHKFEVSYANKNLKEMRKHYRYLSTNEWNKNFDVAMDIYKGQLALVKGDNIASIKSFEKYIKRFSKTQLSREEAFAEIFYYLGQAYYEEGNNIQARITWEKALLLNDEPANHIFKRKSQEKINLLNYN